MITATNRSIRPRTACELLGISLPTFWRWAKQNPNFPKITKLSSRCSVVSLDALIEWRDAKGGAK